MTSIFKDLEPAPRDPILALSLDARAAKEPKADLIIGAYRDEEGRPYPLQVVRKAEQRLISMGLDREYLPMFGHGPFIEEATKMAYGDSVPMERVVGAQGLSGTGSLSLGAHLLCRVLPADTAVYVSTPTWPNHYAVFRAAGLKNIREYRYYDPKTRRLDFEGLIEDLKAAPAGSIVVLHACAHNPTGVDPTKEQWQKIADVCKSGRLTPFFDSAYQGYATGSLVNDVYSVRLFAKMGLEIVLAQSFAKNMGLYCERVGVCSVAVSDASKTAAIRACFESIARSFYSMPPAHGARVAHLVLSDPELRKEWEEELGKMVKRVQAMRRAVYDGLKKRGTPGTWEHVIDQIGMFSYLGLTEEQCLKLREKRVFVLNSGRANMAALTHASVDVVVKAIDEVVRETQGK
ncbi:putative Aminotransferase class I and II [Trypanosoma vivax]|nr:putative Aminotransferase class I and II [Trypanosoma vivax]